MKNLKKIILMISIFAITGASVNCSFRSQAEGRSARIRENKIINQQRSGLSSQLSTSGHKNSLRRNGFSKLTKKDSIQVRKILNYDHERQNEFSNDFIEFIDIIRDRFTRFNSDDLYFDSTFIVNFLKLHTSFSQLRKIYLDSILYNIEFIKKIFEQEIVFDIIFKVDSEFKKRNFFTIFDIGINPLDYPIQIPLRVFLMFNIFEGSFDYCERTDFFTFFTDEEFSYDIKSIFEATIKGKLENIEKLKPGNACDYLQINFNFIVECFIRNIENQNLKSIKKFTRFFTQNIENIDLELIETFVKFIVQNFEEDEKKSILFSYLRFLNPRYVDIIINRLSNYATRQISLSCFSITPAQLCFIIPFLEQLTNLQILYLSDNQLTRLPVSIRNLVNLTYLDLSGTLIKSFDWIHKGRLMIYLFLMLYRPVR